MLALKRLKSPSLGPLKKSLRFAKRQLPPLNFITIHYIYFFTTCLVSAIIFWGASTPPRSISFTDSLFLCVSAMTLAGLNTINLSATNTFQQILLFFLIMLGSAILVSAVVVQIRKHAFERRFKVIVTEQQERRKKARNGSRGRSWSLRRPTLDPNNALRAAPKEDDRDRNTASQDFHEKDMDHNTVSSLAQTIGTSVDHPTPTKQFPAVEQNGASTETNQAYRLTFRPDTRFGSSNTTFSPPRRRGSLISMQGVGARPNSSLQTVLPAPAQFLNLGRVDEPRPVSASERRDITKYFESFGGWVSRNSQFHGLSEREREKLGGYEYRAVSLLAWLVPAYFILFQLLGCLGCAAWIASRHPEVAAVNALNPWWVGAFNAVSAFNNSGMSLLDANMTAFQTGYYILLTMGLLILAGNTCYPIFLRLIVWTMWRLVNCLDGEKWEERARTLRFLLDHPRRCYTNLFPAQHTWWLLVVVVILNGTDWAAFEILNINNERLTDLLPTDIRVIDGLFQALAVRSGGFYVVSIPTLRISLQVLYVVMMYISVYPVVITMRNSNVYEERSLGIYADEQPTDGETTLRDTTSLASRNSQGLLRRARTLRDHLSHSAPPSNDGSNSHFVRQQLRAQLAHDAWTIVLALFLILIIESSQFENNPIVFSAFNFLFEVVSAYGCVGISVGLPSAAYSFCGSWHALSKLILCAVMLRGRHRGLPVAIDKAVLLPGDATGEAEEDDGRIRLARTRTMSRGRAGVEV
nr:low-affinity potassium transport protein [Quercus suber]